MRTPAFTLGLAGALPFLAGAGALLAGFTTVAHVPILTTLLVYAATIVSFLGGTRWGAAMALGRGNLVVLSLAVAPSIAGWLLAGVPGGLGGGYRLALFAVILMLLFIWDAAEVREGTFPRWYGQLRLLLTALAAGSLIVAAGAVWFQSGIS
jgi:hypothetical protein